MDILRIYIYLSTKDSWCKSRKTGIDSENRIVYTIDDSYILIIACKGHYE